MDGNTWLIVGGVLSGTAAFLHLLIISGGPRWYRLFGVGERMAQLTELGSPKPMLLTLAVAIILAVWSAYAFSAAGFLPPLPLMGPTLALISAVYLLRGAALLPMLLLMPWRVSRLSVQTSMIMLACGFAYGVGTWMIWPQLAISA